MRAASVFCLTFLVAGCVQAPTKCPPCDCKDGTAAKPGAAGTSPGSTGTPTALSEAESTILQPFLTEIREGIKPWDEMSVGLCRGVGKDCEQFLGTSSDELPEGEYMLRANLRVPRVGEKGTWKVVLETACTTTHKTESGESANENTSSKEYEVRYVGEERGYRLSPLRKISSPNKGGKQSCTWKLISKNPGGDSVIEGHWAVPAVEE